MAGIRTEEDPLGTLELPANGCRGIHAQRALGYRKETSYPD
ncbi:MAG: hypothetical protein RBR16_05645 [Syntrophus sp. (in: bacteria)]|nr:hypothetical protein [Syntrophus sp. (in: bacteria)]